MLETKRCKLFKIQEADYEDIMELYIDERVRQFLGGIIEEHTYKIKFDNMIDAEKQDLYLVVRYKDDNQFIGLVSLDRHHDGISTEISYQLLPKWWGNGYATEIAQEVIDFAFEELRLTKVVAETQTANKSSIKLLKRFGMSLEKTVQRFGEEQSIFSIRNTKTIDG